MPLVSRLFLKLSLAYFVLATALGAMSALGLGGLWASFFPTWLHLFVVGWITQMIFGVALWLFPKFSKERPRGYEALSWTALVGLNAGLLLRAVAEPASLMEPGPPWSWLLVVSAALQWVAGLAFAANIWPRIQAPRKRKKRKAATSEGS